MLLALIGYTLIWLHPFDQRQKHISLCNCEDDWYDQMIRAG